MASHPNAPGSNQANGCEISVGRRLVSAYNGGAGSTAAAQARVQTAWGRVWRELRPVTRPHNNPAQACTRCTWCSPPARWNRASRAPPHPAPPHRIVVHTPPTSKACVRTAIRGTLFRCRGCVTAGACCVPRALPSLRYRTRRKPMLQCQSLARTRHAARDRYAFSVRATGWFGAAASGSLHARTRDAKTPKK